MSKKNKYSNQRPAISNQQTVPSNNKPPEKNSKTITNSSRKFIFDNTNIALGILVIAVLVAFFGGFSNSFVDWDDPTYITGNKYIQNPTIENLFKLLGAECSHNYHPLTMLSLWFNTFLFGKGAASFIITNTIIHIINTILVFFFTQKLTKSNNTISFFTALIWAVHPMHVESVTWISERKFLLYVCFFLLSCLQYIKFLEAEHRPSGNRKFIVYSFIFFVLACLSKGMAVVLPLVLMIIDYWWAVSSSDKNWLSQKNIFQKIPFFIVALLFGMLAIHIQSGGNLGGILEKLSVKDIPLTNNYSLGQRFVIGFFGFAIYVIKFFVPIHLHHFYAYPPDEILNSSLFLLTAFIGLIILFVAILAYQKQKVVFFCIAFYFITILTVLQFLSVGRAIIAERYSYLSYFGLVFLLIFILNKFLGQRILTFVGSIIAVLFIILTYQQTKTYKNTITLLENSYQYELTSTNIAEGLMVAYQKENNLQKSIEFGEIAQKNGSNSILLYQTLGNNYFDINNLKSAAENYKKGILVASPTDKGDLYYDLGLVNQATKNYKESVSNFEEAINLNSNVASSWTQKATSNFYAQNYAQAEKDYSEMIKRNISPDSAYTNRAVTRTFLGNSAGAIQDLQEAIKINPNYHEAIKNLKILTGK